MSDLRQESVVEIADQQVAVVSEVLLDPEPMVVNTVVAGGRILRKTHVALPPSSTKNGSTASRVEADALRLALQGHHLRFVQALLSVGPMPDESASRPGTRAGVLASMVFGPAGEILSRAGEDQVPAGWLKAAYLATGLGESIAARLDEKSFSRAVLAGDGIGAMLGRAADKTNVTFVDPKSLAKEDLGGLRGELEELSCLPR